MKHLNALSIALLVSSNLFAVKQGKVWKSPDSAQSGQPAAMQPTSPTSPMAPVTTTDASAQPAAAAAAASTTDDKQDAAPTISRLQRLINDIELPSLSTVRSWYSASDIYETLSMISQGTLNLKATKDARHTGRALGLLIEKEQPEVAIPYLAKILAEVKRQDHRMDQTLAIALVKYIQEHKEAQLREIALKTNALAEQLEIIKVSETAAKISGSVQEALSDDEGYCGTNSLVTKMNSRKLLT